MIKSKFMKVIGISALLLSAVVVNSASLLWGQQPECPEELIK